MESQLINLPIDLEQLSSIKNQLPAEDYEKLVRERPGNLYMASRIKGIRETTLQTLAFLSKVGQKQDL